MDDFLGDIAAYLQNQSVGTAETDIFWGVLPAEPDDCVALLGTVGTTLTEARDVSELQFPRFQVIVRNGGYADGLDKLAAVRSALHGIVDLILPVGADPEVDSYRRVLRCHAEQEGGPIGQDERGRFEFSINFIAEHHFVAAE